MWDFWLSGSYAETTLPFFYPDMVTLCSSSHSGIRHFKAFTVYTLKTTCTVKCLVNIHTHIYHSRVTHLYQNNYNLGKSFLHFCQWTQRGIGKCQNLDSFWYHVFKICICISMVLKLKKKTDLQSDFEQGLHISWQMCMLCLVTCFAPATSLQAVNFKINTFKMCPILCAQGYFSLCYGIKWVIKYCLFCISTVSKLKHYGMTLAGHHSKDIYQEDGKRLG